MKRILVPVDGSECALRALRYAIARAKDTKSEIDVLHVEPPAPYQEARLYAMREDIARLHKEAIARLVKQATDILEAEKIPHRAHIAGGEIANVVARFVQDEKVDEIVMGTRGMSALGQVFLGSVASRVVHFVSIPVTLVK
jgi:nucleotide-binding universal stress UspA family protein